VTTRRALLLCVGAGVLAPRVALARAARNLGLAIPSSLLARADHAIE
jgi:hypothetical protein